MLSSPLSAPGSAVPRSADRRRRGVRALLVVGLVVGLAAVAVLLWAWWPAGVALGLVVGVLAVLVMGRRMSATAALETQDVDLAQAFGVQPAAASEPAATRPEPARRPEADVRPEPVRDPGDLRSDAGVRADLARLRVELGDDYDDFGRAARLVVDTQYASAARLQRELELPYARARRLLADLESEHFVGPPTGSQPRVVLMPRDRLPEIERLFADA